ncbi:MAG: Exosome complex component Csl4 [Candidatus Thorarchaeota archaeon]|nr:MAG: Exosome complex component Csl4 [Candidatus Thorarchaeota archaeon]
MADVKSGDVVVPGDQLCVIEELSPSLGTFEKDGIVYAATFGGVSIDFKERSIQVLSAEGDDKLSLPVEGDVLMGEVTNVWDQRAEVSIVKRNDENALSPFIGEIHISNVTRRYVKSMRDVLKPQDVVRARAISSQTIPTELSLVGQDFGVILGKCVRCGNVLTLTTHNNLICLRCEHRETREVAKDYGQRFGLETRPDLAPRRRSRSDRRYGGRDSRRGRGSGKDRGRSRDRRR